jgi:Zn-dependent protease with chaperone function
VRKGTALILPAMAVVLVIIFLGRISLAQSSQTMATRDTILENRIIANLNAINPDAVPLFKDATQSFDNNQLEKAKEEYEAVIQLAPDFPDAERRLSKVELRIGDASKGLYHAERAFAADSSPFNMTALASAIFETKDSSQYALASIYAQRAADSLPDDAESQLILLMAGIMTKKDSVIMRASDKVVKLMPGQPYGHFYYAFSLAQKGKWEKAEHELLFAQQLGVPSDDVEKVLSQGIRSNARFDRWKRWGLYVLGIWAFGLGILFLLGIMLSNITLHTVARTQATGAFKVGKLESYLRSVYRSIITFSSVFFYLSIPIVIALVIAAVGLFIYLCLELGRVPIQLMAFVLASALMTLIAVIRSLFARSRDEDPGKNLGRDASPDLWSLTNEVAEKVQTRPIEAIYITPGTEVAVLERGGFWQKFQGKGKRCLILGLAAIKGLKIDPFKSILSHEYGHFSNRDTAGGNLANQTSRSMYDMAFTLVINRLSRWYNPAWWFLRGYSEVFLRVTRGASRLQEILADRIAGAAYGCNNFVDGLTHIIRQELVFDRQLKEALNQKHDTFMEMKNLYNLPPLDSSEIKEDLDKKLSEVINQKGTIYDSHPPPNERFALLEKLDLPEPEKDGSGEVGQLLGDFEKLQLEMTEVIQGNIRNRIALNQARQT